MDFKRQALTDAAQRGVIRHGFGGRKAKEFAQRQGIAAAPADAAFRVNVFEIPDQQHAEIAARRDGFAAELGGVERCAQVFDVGIKALLVQDFLQPLVKNMPLLWGS